MIERSLTNNINVIYQPIDGHPFCGIEIWIHFGAADDPIGRSGIAHFLEHLLYCSLDEINPYLCYNRSASTSKDRIRFGGTFGCEHAVEIVNKIIDSIFNFEIAAYHFEFQKQKVLHEINYLVKAPILEYVDFFEKKATNPLYGYSKSTFGLAADVESIDYQFAKKYWQTNLYKGITISLTGNLDIDKIYRHVERKIEYKCILGKSDVTNIDRADITVDACHSGKMFVYDVGCVNKFDVLTTFDYLMFSLRDYPIIVKNFDYKQCRAICVYIPDDCEYYFQYNQITNGLNIEKQFQNICEYRRDSFKDILYTPATLAKFNLEDTYFFEGNTLITRMRKIHEFTIDQLMGNITRILSMPRVIISSVNNKSI